MCSNVFVLDNYYGNTFGTPTDYLTSTYCSLYVGDQIYDSLHLTPDSINDIIMPNVIVTDIMVPASSLKRKRSGKPILCKHKEFPSVCDQCKKNKLCEHQVMRTNCKKCKLNGTGGGSICEHMYIRSKCIKCKINGTGGGSFCNHNAVRSDCKKCKANGTGGGHLCLHLKRRTKCEICNEDKFCNKDKFCNSYNKRQRIL